LLAGEFQELQVAPRPQAKDEEAERNPEKKVMRVLAAWQPEQHESDAHLQDRRPAAHLAPLGTLHHQPLAQNFIPRAWVKRSFSCPLPLIIPPVGIGRASTGSGAQAKNQEGHTHNVFDESYSRIVSVQFVNRDH
jgi:hypothetical protein